MRRVIIGTALFFAVSGLFGAEKSELTASNAVVRVQCHAVTRSGTRCKRRAAANENYCKQHSASRKAKKPEPKCRAMTAEGRQCDKSPLPDRFYCSDHIKQP